MRRGWRIWTAAGATSGFVAVCAGAFAAHGMTDPRAAGLMRTGSTYELAHALAILACAGLFQGARRGMLAPACFLAGSVLFSGSLYALAFGAPRWTGVITPFGGLLFLAGWAALGWSALGDCTA
ncbi:MAG TPA: DUF423 domain-containing protein [Caulobacteraceae bacterium]|nr:DUF423 domain-containing protein [Caulobacteraceae bacterium]